MRSRRVKGNPHNQIRPPRIYFEHDELPLLLSAMDITELWLGEHPDQSVFKRREIRNVAQNVKSKIMSMPMLLKFDPSRYLIERRKGTPCSAETAKPTGTGLNASLQSLRSHLAEMSPQYRLTVFFLLREGYCAGCGENLTICPTDGDCRSKPRCGSCPAQTVAGCEWKQEKPGGGFRTSCGYEHSFGGETPEEHDFAFCPYCGKKMQQELFPVSG